MRTHTTRTGALAAALAAIAIAAPAAGARVADEPVTPTAPLMDNEPALRPPLMDNEPTTLVKIDDGLAPMQRSAPADMPTWPSHPQVLAPAQHSVPAGMPTWPSHPQAVTPAQHSAPATDGVDWGEAGLIGGGVLGLAAISASGAVVIGRRRRHGRIAVAG